MDEMMSINKVTAQLNISSRTLRYWESAGLFHSRRDIQSGWRIYDEYALQCIRVTDLFRRLDISISDIKEILDKKTVEVMCSVLSNQLKKLDKMGLDIHSRKDALSELIIALHNESSFTLSSIENILFPMALERKKYNISKIKGALDMENLKTKYSDIQIIKMPPMRAAAHSYVGIEPEDKAMKPVSEWIHNNNLQGTMRLFGFNTEPYPTNDNPSYGFGFCASVPEGIIIPEPLYEMRLPGGIYAVISGYEGDPSYGWKKVNELFNDSEWEWEYDNDRNPGFEEHIEKAEGGYVIPILIPVKKKV